MGRRTVLTGLAGLAAIAIALTGCSSAPQATETPVATSEAVSSAPTTTASSTPTPTPTPIPTSTPTSSTPRTTPKTTAKTTPTTTKAKPRPAATNPLTGGKVSKNPVVAVKIDNTSGGRPQYGISQADVVYIEQVEGGLTRMMAVFHTHLPTEVGAVRSVRTTDVELLRAYGKPILVFSGGAGGPLAVLAASPVIDGSTADGYWRSDAAYTPYNLHADLTRVVASVTGEGPAQNVGFTFAKKYRPLAKAAKATSIEVTMQAGYTGFRYDPVRGNYQVQNSGGRARDATGVGLNATNVLVQNVVDEPDGNYDSIGSPSYLSHTVGTGTFTLYRDGRVIDGTWSRKTADDPTTFINKATDKPVGFKPGNTWVMLAPQTSQVTVG